MQVILDSSFRPSGFSPYMGREERRVQGLDYLVCYFCFEIDQLPQIVANRQEKKHNLILQGRRLRFITNVWPCSTYIENKLRDRM